MGTAIVEAGKSIVPAMFLNTADRVLLEKLREAEFRISDNSGRFNRVSMEIGWDGYFIKSHDGWQLLGYQDQHSFRKSKGIGRATWFKMVGIAERLSHLTREVFCSMTVENAEQLSLQPSSIKRDPELIMKAQTTTAAEFRDELVDADGTLKNTPVKERYVTIQWQIRQSQREVIERGLEDWQHEHGLDDPGFALELLLAEMQARPTLVGFMTESIPRLTREVTAAQSIRELRNLRALLAQHIQEMAEVLRLVCGEKRLDED